MKIGLDQTAVAVHTGVGMEAIEGLRFLASLPLAGTRRTEGGEKRGFWPKELSKEFSEETFFAS